MNNDIPDSAYLEAYNRVNNNSRHLLEGQRIEVAKTDPYASLAASLIAQYESEPVDPLLVEAREIAVRVYEIIWKANTKAGIAPDAIVPVWEYTSGEADNKPLVQECLAALRRGMELAESDRVKYHEGDPVLNAAREALARELEEDDRHEDACIVRAGDRDYSFTVGVCRRMAEVMKERGL